jgi:hypothetical protein
MMKTPEKMPLSVGPELEAVRNHARATFRMWERLRIYFNLCVVAGLFWQFLVEYGLCWESSRAAEFTVFFVSANVFYFSGPVLSLYAHWLGGISRLQTALLFLLVAIVSSGLAQATTICVFESF